MKRVIKRLTSVLVPIVILLMLLPSCGDSITLLPKPVTASTIESVSLVPLSLSEANLPTAKISNTYFWKFNDILWSWELRVPETLYEYFNSLPRKTAKDYSVYLQNPIDNECLNKMAGELRRVASLKGFNEKTTVEFAASFVQSIAYSADEQTTGFTDYPRYPLQTLADKTGDCEDSSILLAALLRSMGYNAALVYFNDSAREIPHYGVGIAGVEGAYGTNWEYEGLEYFYIETTEPWWRIGAIPGIFAPYAAEVHTIKPSPFVQCTWNSVVTNGLAEISLEVANIGNAATGVITINASYMEYDNLFFCCAGTEYSGKVSVSLSLEASESKQIILHLPEMPINEGSPNIQIIYNGDSIVKYTGG